MLNRIYRVIRNAWNNRESNGHEDNTHLWVSPGHFYSPIPDFESLVAHRERLFRTDRPLAGIDLRADSQLAMLEKMCRYYEDFPFRDSQQLPAHYFDNVYFPYFDAVILFAMLQVIRPQRVIEVGSGFSSAVMLDVAARQEMSGLNLTFIDPDLSRLEPILQHTSVSPDRYQTLQSRVEDVGHGIFQSLRRGDVLFIDSSHVLKTGNDVHFLLFDVIPKLSQGVYVHIHDIHFPFEYPELWLDQRRAWNEAYAVRAFLSFNSAFEIVIFNDYLVARHSDTIKKLFPGMVDRLQRSAAKVKAGSLWLRRVS